MNLNKLLSESNFSSLKLVSTKLFNFLKSNKIMMVSTTDSEYKYRINPSIDLLDIQRSLEKARNYQFVQCDELLMIELKSLVKEMCEMLEDRSSLMCSTIKQYSLGAEKRICRECISYLENSYILGEIEFSLIEKVYSIIDKPLPKKFASLNMECTPENMKVYASIQQQMDEQTVELRTNTIQHYKKMVDFIDSIEETKNIESFMKVARTKLSDISAIRMCIDYKFNYERFLSFVSTEVDNMIITSANRIVNHIGAENEILIKETTLGNKGFDVWFKSESRNYNARAIPVNGTFVRFHYRYIIS